MILIIILLALFSINFKKNFVFKINSINPFINFFHLFYSPVDAVMGLRLSFNDSRQLVTIADLPGDVLLVPQATLGGKVNAGRVEMGN